MIRRDFVKNSLAVAAFGLTGSRASAAAASCTEAEFPKAPGLTKYVSEFIVNTKYEDIPDNVLGLGKKSILDGFGLALAGSASTMGPLVREYLQNCRGCATAQPASSARRSRRRRVSRHSPMAFRFTPTISTTRSFLPQQIVYTVCSHIRRFQTLPPGFALAEVGTSNGKDFLLALSRGRRSGMQDCRGHFAATLQRRIPHHGHMRLVWQHRRVRKAYGR